MYKRVLEESFHTLFKKVCSFLEIRGGLNGSLFQRSFTMVFMQLNSFQTELIPLQVIGQNHSVYTRCVFIPNIEYFGVLAE